MRDLRELRDACEKLVATIEVPKPFDIRQFCDNVAAHRERPIKLFDVANMAGEEAPYGAWVAVDDEDRIYLEQNTSSLHRTQIVLHECAHILCGHAPNALRDEEFLRQVVPDVNMAAILHMFSRHGYTTEQEREAEMVASILLGRTGLHHAEALPEDENGTLSRLSEALGHPRRDERRA